VLALFTNSQANDAGNTNNEIIIGATELVGKAVGFSSYNQSHATRIKVSQC